VTLVELSAVVLLCDRRVGSLKSIAMGKPSVKMGLQYGLGTGESAVAVVQKERRVRGTAKPYIISPLKLISSDQIRN
jgi:hypothetical protein